MNFASSATPEFWDMYRKLPVAVRNLARKTYLLWSREAFHPSLHFKKISGRKWSVRIGLHYRAVGAFEGELFVWDWIGSHEAYNQLVKRL